MEDNTPITDANPPDNSAPATAPTQPAASPEPVQPKGGKKKISFFAALIILVLLVAGSAAAYLGIVVPNRPENVFKKAIGNTLRQRKVKVSGSLSFSGSGQQASVAALFSSKFSGYWDYDKKQASGDFELTAAGVPFRFDYVFFEKSIYFKVKDVHQLLQLASGLFGSSTNISALEKVSRKVNNRWIAIDETLLRSSGLGCLLDQDLNTGEDIKFIETAYGKNMFAKINESSDDNFNGREAVKLKLSLDKDKVKSFAKEFKNAPMFKRISDNCKGPFAEGFKQGYDQSVDSQNGSSSIDGLDNVTFVIWVDKATKNFAKVEVSSTQQGLTTAWTLTFDYTEQTVTKPQNPTPLLIFISEINSAIEELKGGSLFPGN